VWLRSDSSAGASPIAGVAREGSRRLRERAAEIALSVAGGGLPERHVVVNQDLYDRLVTMPELAGVPRGRPAPGGVEG